VTKKVSDTYPTDPQHIREKIRENLPEGIEVTDSELDDALSQVLSTKTVQHNLASALLLEECLSVQES
jgi:hypothetical protein